MHRRPFVPTSVVRFFRTHKSAKFMALLCFLVFISLLAALPLVLTLRSLAHQTTLSTPVVVTSPATVVPTTFFHPLTGSPLTTELKEIPEVYGAMIDGSSDAWPPSGLNRAFAVFEAPVEGNIPRFFALFSAEEVVPKIGPIRSARPYFVEWSRIFHAAYVHVGGSPDGLQKIRDLGAVDIDEFFQSQVFWRAKDRFAPHNAYTSSELILGHVKKKHLKIQPLTAPWVFAAEPLNPSPVTTEARIVGIPFGTNATYKALWTLDQKQERYTRSQKTQSFLTQDGASLTASNLLILESEVKTLDEVGRKQIETVGSGRFSLFQEGVRVDGVYVRKTVDTPFELRTESGETVPLIPGPIWISLVPNLSLVEVTP